MPVRVEKACYGKLNRMRNRIMWRFSICILVLHPFFMDSSSISPLALGDISAYACGYLRVCLEISPLLLLILTRLSEKWDCILGRYGGNLYLC